MAEKSKEKRYKTPGVEEKNLLNSKVVITCLAAAAVSIGIFLLIGSGI